MINVASIAGTAGLPFMSYYAATLLQWLHHGLSDHAPNLSAG
jgi:short-subunit dehydrogenase